MDVALPNRTIDRFRDRAAGGRALVEELARYSGRWDAVVLALPRGGVPVGYELAVALNLELDVLVVRKLGVPGHREVAMGALVSGGAVYRNEDIIRAAGVTAQQFDAVVSSERAELVRRELLYRGTRPPVVVEGRIVILVDDGIATGASMYAAVSALRSSGLAHVVVAVPVASPDARDFLEPVVDEFIAAMSPSPFYAVGQFYENFEQTNDDEVRDLLARAGRRVLA